MAERKTGPAQEQLVKLDWSTFKLICERLEEHGGKYKACADLGFNYATVRDAIASANARDDREWQELWDLSYATFQERIEQEAIRRAVDGVERDVYGRVDKDQDGVVGQETVYSDSLLQTLLKGHHERYRERAPVILGAGLEVPDIFAQLTPEARKKVRDIIVMDLAEQAALAKSPEVIEIEANGVQMLEDQRKKAETKPRGKKKGAEE